MSLSNDIARILMEMLENNGTTEIQRNELAQSLGCVPSQINYVISSRFTPEQGYIVESRRGGGGYIKITRVNLDRPSLIMHTVNYIGDAIDFATCHANVMNLLHNGAVTAQSAKLLLAATGENALKNLPAPVRDRIRASILKQMLISIQKG
ncbi:MAG: CtsR family transcriptional regulator [Ruminococcaceae bacterium]|nr:CtsR family transcriptional regulator [Oscillospiraceae bacterium]